MNAALIALALAAGATPSDVTREFSSARLATRGRASWQYGRIEVRGLCSVDPGGFPREFAIDWVHVWQRPAVAARVQAAVQTGKAGGR